MICCLKSLAGGILDTVASIPMRKIRRSPQKSSLEVRSENKSNGLHSPLRCARSISIGIRLIRSKRKHIRLSVLHFVWQKRIRLNALAFLAGSCDLEGIAAGTRASSNGLHSPLRCARNISIGIRLIQSKNIRFTHTSM